MDLWTAAKRINMDTNQYFLGYLSSMPIRRRLGRHPSIRGTTVFYKSRCILASNLGIGKYCWRLHCESQYDHTSRWRWQIGAGSNGIWQPKNCQSRFLGAVEPLQRVTITKFLRRTYNNPSIPQGCRWCQFRSGDTHGLLLGADSPSPKTKTRSGAYSP